MLHPEDTNKCGDTITLKHAWRHVNNYYNVINNFSAITITELRTHIFRGLFTRLHTLSNKNGTETHPPYVVTPHCSYGRHASGTHHAWNLFVMAEKLLITL